jgi:hypothetical protein
MFTLIDYALLRFKCRWSRIQYARVGECYALIKDSNEYSHWVMHLPTILQEAKSFRIVIRRWGVMMNPLGIIINQKLVWG